MKSDNPRNREESKTKFISKFIPISIYNSYGMRMPLFHPLCMGERKQFSFQGLMCHARNIQAQTQLLKFPKVDTRIFAFFSKEGLLPNHGYESRVKLIARCKDMVS
jgi:hypothetical protein